MIVILLPALTALGALRVRCVFARSVLCQTRPTLSIRQLLKLKIFSGKRVMKMSSKVAPRLVPVELLREAILIVLEDLGGEARCKAVVDKVGWLLSRDLSSYDRRQLQSGAISWEARVRSCGRKLGLDGVLAWHGVSHGVWRLAE